MNDIKQYIDWRGPFAETPNQFYQKCFELFKQFIRITQTLSNPIELIQLKTKDIHDILVSNQKVKPTVERDHPLITFPTIYKLFKTVQLQLHDLNFAY